MKSESDHVGDEEVILRRVVLDPQFYDPSSPEPISPQAFRPTKADVDGLSVFREAFCSAAEVASSGPNPKGYCVAGLGAEFIREQGLSLQPAPNPRPPSGHTLIPEMCYEERPAPERKRKLKEWQRVLAVKACEMVRDSPSGPAAGT